MNCSYGNGLRLSGKAEYKDVMIEAANSLCTRFREKPGTIQSWNVSGIVGRLKEAGNVRL